MSRYLAGWVLIFGALCLPASADNQAASPGHYLFAWAGDVDKQGNDFLAVIDADHTPHLTVSW
jgi:hypothetical protein